MDTGFISSLFTIIQEYPVIALSLVFIVAMTESLVVIGLIVPGAVLMILFGALISLGALSFWPVTLIAILGAVSGDTLSYWLGKKYKQQLIQSWPINRYPGLLSRAESFFEKHGAKSIILSRFIGPLRPIIPAIAGVAGLSSRTFLLVNVSSAIVWAPVYLLPGILFGLSLEVAGDFAKKFALFIITILLSIFFILWLIRILYKFTRPYAIKLTRKLVKWSLAHRYPGNIVLSILDSGYRERYGLSIVAIILFSTTYLFYFLRSNGIYLLNFDSIDRLIFLSLHKLQSPSFELFLSWLNYLASDISVAFLCFSFGLLLLLRKDFHTFWHWLAAIALPLIISPLLASPLTSILSEQYSFRFSSLPFIIILSSAGFYITIISLSFAERIRIIFYYLFSLLIILIAIAQLYFAEQVFSQILAGLVLGITWFTLLNLAYQKHLNPMRVVKHRWEHIFILMLLMAFSIVKVIEQPDIHLQEKASYLMGTKSWLDSGWSVLPANRKDIYQRKIESFNLQFAGKKNTINYFMKQFEFIPSTNTKKKFANWFKENPNPDQLPLLPHVHNGKYEKIRFYHYYEKENKYIVFRLWRSRFNVKQDSPSIPLWYGSINSMSIKENAGLNYLVTDKNRSGIINFITDLNSTMNLSGLEINLIRKKDSSDPLYLVYETIK